MSAQGWQPIATAPLDEVVWCFEPHDEGGFMFSGWRSHDGRWGNNLDGETQYPTHWMPLPDAPVIA